MTRRRSRASGRNRPDRRRSLLFLGLAAVLVVAACGGTPVPTAAPTDSGAKTTDPTTPEPATPEPATAPPDSPEPSEAPSEAPSESPSTEPGAAAACSGNDKNRAFFVSIAEKVDWPVYCAVLPDGWFVGAGRWGLAGGGWLEITYRGPGGAGLELREGVSCEGGCLPSGEGTGTTSAFGDQTGELLRLDDGRLSVVVDQDTAAAWAVIGSGMDDASLVAIAADLARVGD